MPVFEKKFVPVMITPYQQNGRIDFYGLSKLIDFYIAAGVKGLFANCLSSEMFSISDDERLALTKHVVDHVNRTVPVVATGSFGATIEDKANFTSKIYDTGIGAVIMITSHFANMEDNEDVLLKNFEKMFRLTGNIPLGMYECPAPYKRIIPAETFRKLLGANRFVYHKDTSITPENVKAKLDVLKEMKNNSLEFYDAHTPNTMFSLQEGAKGMSAIAGNFYPEILVWMCNNATDPDKRQDVEWLQSEITRVDPLIHQAYPVSAKFFLQKRGLPIEVISRSFVFDLSTEQKKILDKVHLSFLSWCERLDIKAAT